MNKSLAVGLYLTALICSTVGGAFADDDDGPPGDGPEQSQGGRGFHGGFPGGGPGGGGGGGFKRSHGARPPKMEQVMSLKSLSKDQQTKIQTIYSGAKEEMKPLMQQMRESRDRMRSGAGGGAGGSAGPGGSGADGSGDGGQRRGFGEGMVQLRPIMQQLRAKREATWTKVKAVLTDAQVKELEQMRAGEHGPGGRGGEHGHGGGGGAPGPGGHGGRGGSPDRGQDGPLDGEDQWTRGGPPGDPDDQ